MDILDLKLDDKILNSFYGMKIKVNLIVNYQRLFMILNCKKQNIIMQQVKIKKHFRTYLTTLQVKGKVNDLEL